LFRHDREDDEKKSASASKTSTKKVVQSAKISGFANANAGARALILFCPDHDNKTLSFHWWDEKR
jgi:hypothetical protein